MKKKICRHLFYLENPPFINGKGYHTIVSLCAIKQKMFGGVQYCIDAYDDSCPYYEPKE